MNDRASSNPTPLSAKIPFSRTIPLPTCPSFLKLTNRMLLRVPNCLVEQKPAAEGKRRRKIAPMLHRAFHSAKFVAAEFMSGLVFAGVDNQRFISQNAFLRFVEWNPVL